MLGCLICLLFVGATQIRAAHLDVPNFDAVKRDTPKDKDADYSRRAFTYLIGAGGAIASAHLAKSIVQDFLDTMSASVIFLRARLKSRISNVGFVLG